ncbi:hypothetical protein L249_1715, partial [Ophiocordyceps polyrhachis-furcata BCC 54312]
MQISGGSITGSMAIKNHMGPLPGWYSHIHFFPFPPPPPGPPPSRHRQSPRRQTALFEQGGQNNLAASLPRVPNLQIHFFFPSENAQTSLQRPCPPSAGHGLFFGGSALHRRTPPPLLAVICPGRDPKEGWPPTLHPVTPNSKTSASLNGSNGKEHKNKLYRPSIEEGIGIIANLIYMAIPLLQRSSETKRRICGYAPRS